MNESDRSFCPPEAIGGRTPYSEAEYVKAQEWRDKIIALEEKYKAELAGAGYDTGKLTPLGKQFYDEAGPVPESVKPTLFMSKPIVISLYQYQQSLSALEKKDEITPTGTWICSVCGNENQGNFCGCCGKKITLNP